MPERISPSRTGHGRPSGVVILGGAHGALALARALGGKGVPVWLVSNDSPLPGWSRHVRRHYSWPGPEDADAGVFLRDLAKREGFEDALLVAAGDAEVKFASLAIDDLAPALRVVLPPWERLSWVCEKPLLYRRAAELGLSLPETWRSEEIAAGSLDRLRFPIILKPNMGGGHGALARAKVVRIDDPAEFPAAFAAAATEIGAANVVVQELVPGGGESQFSYAALWHGGSAVAEFTARRTRQYPVDFGYTSTFVEVVDEPEAIEAARRLLSSIGHNGLVEIEFKRDPRDGALRLLDVNPRPWSWFGLSAAAGVDLGAMLWSKAIGETVAPASPRIGASWMYLVRDVVSAAILTARGKLAPSRYFASFAGVRSWATFSLADPLPGLLDLPVTAWRVLTRRVLKPALDGSGAAPASSGRAALLVAAKSGVRRAAIRGALEGVSLIRAGRLFPEAAGRGVIFTLHHVRPARASAFDPNAHLAITPEFLDEAIRAALAKGLVPVALEDLPRLLADPADHRRFVAFTLDDGYRDNATWALPVFRRHGIPCTIFLAEGLVERRTSMWWETAEALLAANRSIAYDFGAGEVSLDLATPAAKLAAFHRIGCHLATVDEDVAVAELDRVARSHGIEPLALTDRLVMDREELRALASDPLVRFGAHTLTHVNLRRVDEARLRAELSGSADAVERYAGYRPGAFAYPYGFPAAVGEREIDAAAAAGFAVAVTTQPGVLSPADVERPTAFHRVSLNGFFQKRRYVEALLTGLPFRFA